MLLRDESFLSSLSESPIESALAVIEEAIKLVGNFGAGSPDTYNISLETAAFLSELEDLYNIKSGYSVPNLSGNINQDCSAIYDYITASYRFYASEKTKLIMQSHRSHFRTILGSQFCYEFTQGDLDKVQHLVNQLRDLIGKSHGFEQKHKQRLLDRLEKLQSELHKRVSNLDQFWGLIGDAGVVAGKLGEDAKPIVERIKEIAEIIWRTQSKAEELPSDARSPLLEHKSENEGE